MLKCIALIAMLAIGQVYASDEGKKVNKEEIAQQIHGLIEEAREALKAKNQDRAEVIKDNLQALATQLNTILPVGSPEEVLIEKAFKAIDAIDGVSYAVKEFVEDAPGKK